MEKINNIEIVPFTEKDDDVIKNTYVYQSEYIYVGPKRYVFPATFRPHMAAILNMPLRTTDVFVLSYPRSGTTWTQELVWLLANNLDYEKAKSATILERFPFLERCMIYTTEVQAELEANAKNEEELALVKSVVTPVYQTMASTPSPRFIQSHIPLSLLPANILDSKVVYVARDPRDVAVSHYHFSKDFKMEGVKCDFKEYFINVFSKDLRVFSPYFENVKEAWAQRNHPNLLFIFYEELSADLPGTVRKVASFLGKQYTDEQFGQLCEHLHFSTFQKNSAIDISQLKKLGIFEAKGDNFVRKGKAGGWREHFDEEMLQHFETWMENGLKDTDLRFPQQQT